ncbi:MAG TPA: hypothetical protein VK335_30750 [Bryobacteraceae bacterium]|nr:hypothetical protein [Bryobacteraceae bacterium]
MHKTMLVLMLAGGLMASTQAVAQAVDPNQPGGTSKAKKAKKSKKSKKDDSSKTEESRKPESK